MVASYSQESSIEQAFAETFGGERPCELCKIITAVETAQKTAPIKEPTEINSLKLFLNQAERFTAGPTLFIAAKRGNSDRYGRLRQPEMPTPPPRHA